MDLYVRNICSSVTLGLPLYERVEEVRVTGINTLELFLCN